MLILERKYNESIMIGDVEVLIVRICGNKVKLGVKAPRDIPVHRREIYDAIHARTTPT